MKKWKSKFDCNVDTLFHVGEHIMSRSDLEALEFETSALKPVTDPWAKKSDYDLMEIKRVIAHTKAKAFKSVLEK